MSGPVTDTSRAPVAFGLRAVPQLFEELQQQEVGRKRRRRRQRALNSLCDLMHDPERIYQAVTGGFLEQLKVLFEDEDPSVRTKTCELLHLLSAHSIGRQALLSSSLLPALSQLLDDSSSSCRLNALRVLHRLTLLPAGAEALLTLVPTLMLKLREVKEEEEEEVQVQVLLLSTLSSCSRLDPRPALASDGVSVLGHKLSHRSPNIRREAAAAMMALSVCDDGKRRVCEEAVLPAVVNLLQDDDVEVQAYAAGVIMYTVIIITGKQRCLDLNVVPVLLALVSNSEEEEEDKERRKRRKALVMYSLRALTALAEAPDGRRLLLEQLPLLVRRSEAAEEDQDIRRAAQTAVRVVTWTP
ncbi:radial spoke head 14 homolog [Epinephelus fuscoguttatus]|uniref:radial spoke head 14 homolog n=1 Tax=Epinephelus fuscoguttatus TaxID=293821 RepID=UPI0020D06221|nr:radial spoke head 14 homolog [Epinephelus fuscoguttatus]XP_049435334.1 radial spoke head 14 homolog [Epinephelus fuscoguttatus]